MKLIRARRILIECVQREETLPFMNYRRNFIKLRTMREIGVGRVFSLYIARGWLQLLDLIDTSCNASRIASFDSRAKFNSGLGLELLCSFRVKNCALLQIVVFYYRYTGIDGWILRTLDTRKWIEFYILYQENCRLRYTYGLLDFFFVLCFIVCNDKNNSNLL